jgi:hypothetical protein
MMDGSSQAGRNTLATTAFMIATPMFHEYRSSQQPGD